VIRSRVPVFPLKVFSFFLIIRCRMNMKGIEKNKTLIFALPLLLLVSCTGFQDILERSIGSAPLTSGEVSLGLKEALTVGTDLAVTGLSSENGFFLDEAVKILLPPEAGKAVDLITKIPGGKRLVNDLILRLNRAAEFAVQGAVPIFVDAITSLSISDAFNILRGPDDAATRYLQSATSDSLYALFKPEVNKSLGKRLIGDLSAGRSWELFTARYNQAAGSVAGKLLGIKPLTRDLGEYVTGKALDALFLKLSVEEKRIRENPLARTTALLRRVFGSSGR
jgi:hypothetical protein